MKKILTALIVFAALAVTKNFFDDFRSINQDIEHVACVPCDI